MSPTLLKRLRPLSTSEDRGLSVSQTAKSGVLVFRECGSKTEVLLLHRQKQNDWSFPKGHVEVGEGLLEAGLREFFEEANVQPMLVGRLTDLEYLDGKGRQVRLALFLGYTEEKDYQQNVSPEGEVVEWVLLAQVERTLSYENLRTYFRTYVRPLFSRKRSSDQVRTDVIFAETEPYKNGARLLTRTLLDSGISSRSLELNRLSLKKESRPTGHVSYFLTNHQNVPNAAFWCKQFGHYVVNGEFLRFWHSKSQIQRLLDGYGIPVLPSGPYRVFDKKHLSTWMIKSESHGMRNLQSPEALKRSPWDAYLEQRADEKCFAETKLGYVAGRILTDDDTVHISPEIRCALHRVQELLGLEIFSVDIFFDKTGKFYIVDVNPAPAFFCNEKARRVFSHYIRIIEKFYLK